MKLISCESCGVVLDTDKIIPTAEESEWYPTETKFTCPVCETKIDYFSGETS